MAVHLNRRHKHIPKGDDHMNIVQTYHIGNSTVHICDDYAQEDVENVMQDLQEAGWEIWDNLTPEEQEKLNT